VEITLNDLKAALVGTGNTSITIKSATQSAVYNSNNGRWTGRLTVLDLSKMYVIEIGEACELVLEGMPVNPAEHPATIINGNNWIAFPLSASMSPSVAFAGFAVAQDVVKSQTQSATYNGARWTGRLTSLAPGKGYVYKSNDAASKPFVFPTSK
jgi:hypothetical protein